MWAHQVSGIATAKPTGRSSGEKSSSSKAYSIEVRMPIMLRSARSAVVMLSIRIVTTTPATAIVTPTLAAAMATVLTDKGQGCRPLNVLSPRTLNPYLETSEA